MTLINNSRKNYIKAEVKKLWEPLLNKVLLIFALFLIIVMIIFNPILNAVIKPKLLNSINENKGIHVSIDHVGYNFLTSGFSIENGNINITDPSGKTSDSTRIKIPSCEISGLNLIRVVTGSGLKFEDLVINNPYIFRNNAGEQSYKDGSKQKDKSSLSEKIFYLLPDRMKPLSFEKFIVNSLSAVQVIKGKRYNDSLKTLKAEFNNLSIDSAVINDSLNLKFADGFNLNINGLKYHFKDDYYVSMDKLEASSSDSNLILKSFTYKPYVPDDEFYSHRKFSSDRYILNFPQISLRGINYNVFAWDGNFFIKIIELDSMYFNVCTNDVAPPDPGSIPKMPNELMRSAKEKINIQNVKVKDAELHVKAKHPHVKKYSDVPFSNVDASIINLSNIQATQTENNPCIFHGEGNIFNAGRLTIDLKINLLSENLTLNYRGNLTSMSALPINSQIKYADQVEIKSGKINSAEYSVHILNGAADSYVKPLYEDVKIEQLKENAEEGGVVKKAVSFIANAVALRKSNPDDEGKVKEGTIIYLRKKGDTFMDFVWTAVKNGLGEVVGF